MMSCEMPKCRTNTKHINDAYCGRCRYLQQGSTWVARDASCVAKEIHRHDYLQNQRYLQSILEDNKKLAERNSVLFKENKKLRNVVEAAKQIGCYDETCTGYGFYKVEEALTKLNDYERGEK